MIRTLKKATLGLGLLAALSMTAMGAMSASATQNGHFVSDAAVTVLDISEVTGTEHQTVISFFASTIKCHHSTYSAFFSGSTTQEITVTAEYTNCPTGGGAATVTMNGCHYEFTSRAAPHATVHFKCPSKVKAQLHPSMGTLSFGEQTPNGGVAYTTDTLNGKHAVTVAITASGIKATCHGACQFISPTTISNVTMAGSVTVTGTDAAQNSVNITAT